METKTTQVIGVSPDELIQRINVEISRQIEGLEKRITANKPKKYIDRKGARNKLGVTYGTLDNWDRDGVLKKRKIRGRVFYLESDIERALELS